MGDNRSLESDNWDQLRSRTLQWNDKNLPWDNAIRTERKAHPVWYPLHIPSRQMERHRNLVPMSEELNTVLKAVLLPRLSIWKAHSQRLTWRCRGEKGGGGGGTWGFYLKRNFSFWLFCKRAVCYEEVLEGKKSSRLRDQAAGVFFINPIHEWR